MPRKITKNFKGPYPALDESRLAQLRTLASVEPKLSKTAMGAALGVSRDVIRRELAKLGISDAA